MTIYDKYGGCGWDSTKSDECRQTFSKYLTDLGLNTQRFVDIRSGEKQPNDTVRHYPGEVSGNYGIKAGDGLVIVEIDDHEAGKGEGAFDILPETFCVEGPHGEKTLFYPRKSRENQISLYSLLDGFGLITFMSWVPAVNWMRKDASKMIARPVG